MTTINVAEPTRANVDSAMQSIGFTVDVQNETTSLYTWESSGYCKIKYVQGTTPSDYNNFLFEQYFTGGAVTILATNLYWQQALKICYEELANGGIAMGFTNGADTPITFAFVAPKSPADDWAGVDCYLRVADYSRLTQITYANQQSPYDNASSGITAFSNDVQIIKAYNNQRFMDNVNIVVLGPSMSYGNSVRATIGTTDYLLLGSTYECKIAVELP